MDGINPIGARGGVPRVIAGIALLLAIGSVPCRAQTRNEVVLEGPTLQCLTSSDRNFVAGDLVASASQGMLVDHWNSPATLGQLSFEAGYSCSGWGGRTLTIRFNGWVSNVRARVLADVEPVSVNGAPGVGFTQVPRGQTNLELAGPVHTIELKGQGFRGVNWGWYLAIDTISFEPAEVGSLDVRFDLSEESHDSPDRRILISRHRPGDPNDLPFSRFQNPDDLKFMISGRVTRKPSGEPAAGERIHLKLIDPPDASPYVQSWPGLRRPNDNRDPQDKGSLYADSTLAGVGEPLAVTTDAEGLFSVEVFPTTRYSGDNYEVLASSSVAFGCEASASCASSGPITAWKRIYVERDRMFRKGALLEKPVCPGDNKVFVTDPAPFAAGQTVRLVHGMDFRDRNSPHTKVAVARHGFHSEDAIVEKVEQDPSGDWYLVLKESVSNEYGLDKQLVDGGFPSVRDGVGVVTFDDVGDFFDTNYEYTDDGFDPAYVEIKFVDIQASQDVPYFDFNRIGADVQSLFALRWFENSRLASTPRGHAGRSLPNHHQVVAGTRASDGTQVRTSSAVTLDYQLTWIWTKFVEDEWQARVCAPSGSPCVGKWAFYNLDLDKFFGEQLVHEIAHKFRVNQPGDPGGHCREDSWSGGKWCRMHINNDPAYNADHADGIVEFHFLQQGDVFDSEYLTIRDTANPVPPAQ